MDLPELDDLIAAVVAESPSDDPLERLAAAARTRDDLDHLAEALLDHFVETAREAGCSWSQIGNALGVSKQAAQQRHTTTESIARRLLVRLPGRARGGRRSLFGRFTDHAQSVVVLAQDEARMLDHNYLGTEHLLLGILSVAEGPSAKALESMGISLDRVRSEVIDIIGHGSSAPVGRVPFTPRAKKVLELSLRESLQLGHNYIGTEHILLGIIREGEGLACQVLQRLGAKPAAVRQALMRLLNPAA